MTSRSLFLYAALLAAPALAQSEMEGETGEPGVEQPGPPADERLPGRDAMDFDREGFEEVTVTAPARAPERLGATGRSVTVLDGDTARRAGNRSVGDALRRAQGIEVDQGGGAGSLTTLRIRGAESDHALVLVDGVRVNEFGGGVDLFDLPLDGVERIEVYRGPGSAAWGADALSGVVHIVTRRGAGPPRFGLGTEAAGFGTWHERLWTTGRSGAVSWNVQGTRLDAANDFRNNAFEESASLGRFSLDVGEAGRVDWTADWRQSRNELPAEDTAGYGIGPRFIGGTFAVNKFFPGDPGSTVYTGDGYTRTRSYVSGLGYTHEVSERWTVTVAHHLYRHDASTRDRAPLVSGSSGRGLERQTVEARTSLEWAEGARTGVGVEWSESQVHADPVRVPFPSAGVQETFVSHGTWVEQAVETPQGLNLLAGARASRDTDYGSDTSLRTSATWRARATLTTLRSAWGTGFKAPSLNDINTSRQIRPERVESWEAGADQDLGEAVTLGATWFDQRFSDLVAGFPSRNVGRASADGLETTARWGPTAWSRVTAGYTWTRAWFLRSSNNGVRKQRMLRRPEHAGSLALDLTPTDQLGVGVSALFVGKAADKDFTDADFGLAHNTSSMDYVRLDAGLRYAQTDDLVLSLNVQNLLDEDYDEVAGFPTNGLNLGLGMELAF
ncbi:MAG: TonB-dependent receptor [Planctomycetes bacterium]|nr:TonB-dependent receptor [Planctomycetota bacterium]